MNKPTFRSFSRWPDQPVNAEPESLDPLVRRHGPSPRLAGPNFSFPAAGAQRFRFSTSPSPNFSVSAFQRFRFSNSGSSLVTTLLVVTVLTIIVVAFMQSMSIERMTSRSYANVERARLAAEAGLNLAVQKLSEAVSHTNYSIIRQRTSSPQEEWPLAVVAFNDAGTPVSTNSIRPADSNLGSFSFNWAGLRQANALIQALTNSIGQTNAAFSFSVLDKNALQNLNRFPETPRVFSTTLHEISLIDRENAPFPEEQKTKIASALTNNSTFLQSYPTLDSLNQLLQGELSTEINAEWTTLSSLSPALAPNGQPKIDLRRFKYFIDGLSVSQDAGNPKSQVVEALLGQPSTINSSSWGGGDLTWLVSPSNPARYDLPQARQIAANLIDYLDADLHPTTDDINNPTYFGVEGRLTAAGTVRGHPIVTSIGHGLVFNFSQSAANNGWLNSTRVLTFWSLVNPWNAPIEEFFAFYRVQLEVEILGKAEGGLLGSEAQSYFRVTLDERLSEAPPAFESNPTLQPNSGSTFPQSPSGLSFANINNLQPANRQPPGMRFSNIQFRIRRARLIFEDSSGLSSVVQVLDNLSAVPLPMNPPNFTLPSSAPPISQVNSPGSVRNAHFLASDPRLNFLASAWRQGRLRAAETGSTSPPGGDIGINVFANMNPILGDGAQGVPSNHTWYTTNTSRHFFSRSPAPIDNPTTTSYSATTFPPPAQLAMDTVGEIGYLWSGLPWQTLRLVEPNSVSPNSRRDFLLLDYLDTGTFDQVPNSMRTGLPSQDGKINPTTFLPPTSFGALQNVVDLSEEQKAGLIDFFNSTTFQISQPGELGKFPIFLSPGSDNKFAKENLLRRIINLFSTSPQEFVIQVRGEARDPRNPELILASTLLLAEIQFVQDPATPSAAPKAIIKRIIKQ